MTTVAATYPTSTRDALLRAIRADPADDTVRLAFAEWLDEQWREDEHYEQWAELIRMQCELVRIEKCGVNLQNKEHEAARSHVRRCCWHRLNSRESALLTNLTPWLRKGERCERCKGRGGWSTGPHAEDCPTCHGIGWLGSLAEQRYTPRETMVIAGNWLIPCTIARGFPDSITLTVADVVLPNGDANTARLAAIWGEHPITRAKIEGKVPGFGWWGTTGLSSHPEEDIPLVVWGGINLPSSVLWKYAATEAAAYAALSAAVVSLGRKAAGIG